MTLADIQNSIYLRTSTNSTTFSNAQMVIAINNALERVEALVRTHISNYDVTRYTTSDLTTGTAVPKFRSLFHDLIPLWASYTFSAAKQLPNAALFLQEIQIKEAELKNWYGARNYRVFTVTIATPGVFTLKDHGFKAGDRVIFETSGALPTGLSAETWYYVVSAGLTDSTFRVSSTDEGTVVDTSGSQSGTHFVGSDTTPRMKVSSDSNK